MPYRFTRASFLLDDQNIGGSRVGGKYIDRNGKRWEYYRRGYGAPDDNTGWFV